MKYTVYAKHITYLETEIEADSFEQAHEIASTLEYDDFKETDGEFFIDEVEDEDGMWEKHNV